MQLSGMKISSHTVILALLMVRALVAAPTTPAGAHTSVVTSRTFTITRSAVPYDVEYWSNGNLDVPNAEISNVVFMLHGNSRNADDYARYTADAATSAGRISSSLVVAPHFIDADDSPSSRELYWTESSWKEGGVSESRGRTWAMTSFAVMDMMANAAHVTFPTAQITVAGHSAGGQFVQRYVLGAGQRVVDRYVPMNPGTYMYLDNQRWSGSTHRSLSAREKKACSHWNDYKYGLSNRSGEIASTSTTEARARYAGASVTYLLGGADTLRDSSLDTGCEADWQGRTRLARGKNFFAALQQTMESSNAVSSHSLEVVPGVGHEGVKMIQSAQARPLLFP